MAMDFGVMNQRELTEGRRDKSFLAQVGEEIGSLHRLIAEKHVEGKVATLHLIANGRPFGENDGTDTVGSHQCKGIAPKNVPAEHIADALQVIVGFRIGEKRDALSTEDAEEAFLAFRHIVLLDFDAVEASHGNEGLEFILRPALAVMRSGNGQLPFQYLGQEVTVSASRFEETGVDALRFLLHEVEHSIHFTVGGKHLTVGGYTLFRLDLPFRGGQALLSVFHAALMLCADYFLREYG